MNTNPINHHTGTTVYGVDATKGGSGKSTVQSYIADFIIRNNPSLKCCGFDIDVETSTLARLVPGLSVQSLPKKEDCLNEILNTAGSNQHDLIIFDVPAAYNSELNSFYKRITPEHLKRYNTRFVINVVISPDYDSIETAIAALTKSIPWFDYIAVFNFFEGYDPYPQKLMDLVKAKTVAKLEIPKYPSIPEHKMMAAKNLTWQTALDICNTWIDSGQDPSKTIEGITQLVTHMNLESQVASISEQLNDIQSIFLPTNKENKKSA